MISTRGTLETAMPISQFQGDTIVAVSDAGPRARHQTTVTTFCFGPVLDEGQRSTTVRFEGSTRTSLFSL